MLTMLNLYLRNNWHDKVMVARQQGVGLEGEKWKEIPGWNSGGARGADVPLTLTLGVV